MNAEHDHGAAPDLAGQAARRMTVPSAHGLGAEEDDHQHDHAGHDHDHAFEWPEMLRIALVAVAAACVGWHVWEPIAAVSLIGVTGLLIGGWPIFGEALENL